MREGDGSISTLDFLQWIKSYDSEQSAVITKYAPSNILKENKTKKTGRQSDETRKENTMLLLIIGMAIAKYRHDPKSSRNSTATNIQNSLLEHRIEVSEDTIRGYLGKAIHVLPDNF